MSPDPRKEKRRFSTQSPSFRLPREVSHSLVFKYEHEMSRKREKVSVQNHCYQPPRVPAPGFQQQSSTTSLSGNLKCNYVPQMIFQHTFRTRKHVRMQGARSSSREDVSRSCRRGPPAGRSHHAGARRLGRNAQLPGKVLQRAD